MKNIYQIFNELDINFQEIKHPPVYTVEEAEKHHRGEAAQSKNLFLRNKKGNRHYLVVTPGRKKIDLKNIEKLVGENNLSFASPERLMKYLGVTPGSVSPFGLINDVQKEVLVVVDSELLISKKQGFHPNTNDATLVISTDDFKKFLTWTKNTVSYITL
jgi:Ala-tRNA(Pro) deacylase